MSSPSVDARASGVVKAIINIQPTIRGDVTSLKRPGDRQYNRDHLKHWFDDVTEFEKRTFLLQLVLLHSSGESKTVKAQKAAEYIKLNDKRTLFKYECNFMIPEGFGDIGAVLVQNVYHKETYIKNIVLHTDPKIKFTCESWIHTIGDNTEERIFFSNKSYLPSKTPTGLNYFRKKDLESLRGNGEGERKPYERIYDYDTYNDLGDPDTVPAGPPPTGAVLDSAAVPAGPEAAGSGVRQVLPVHLNPRPVLGGNDHPYPRRCRTGRRVIQGKESRTTLPFYVPRDEEFSDTKAVTYGMKQLYSYVDNLVPLNDLLEDMVNNGVSSFSNLDLLYDQCVEIIDPGNGGPSALRRLLKDLVIIKKSELDIKKNREDDKESFCWFEDEEFCRQTIAGVNPYSIQLVKEWPLMSKLDHEVYGPRESAITKEIVEREMHKQDPAVKMKFDEALNANRLFMLDYHDMFLPYVNKVRALKRTPLYGSRTLMLLTTDKILKPLAIELTRPQNNTGESQWKHVYTPCSGTTIEAWRWKLAKAHVLAHDSCHHQLVSHWLRTHCVMEPYIIATHRCLSKMHPIHRLLFPHLRYTMQTNALARRSLVNADGIIEKFFALGKYSMQFSSDAYKDNWRFDHEALPKDLISRGIAVENTSKKHGVKLRIKDYPFVDDGLILWDAIEEWATAYVDLYYSPPQPQSQSQPQPQPQLQPNLVESDEELQEWWTEIRTVGHGDKRDERWWPELKSKNDLIGVVTTIMWVASGHHSAVNFDQYTAGYYPHKPSIVGIKMPNEDPITEAIPEDQDEVLSEQEPFVISVLDILSTHSPDEEYIGDKIEPAWEAEPTIKEAFHKFRESLEKLDEEIESKNKSPNLRNRKGKGLVPYQLLKPKSEPGVTGKGVPYSISI